MYHVSGASCFPSPSLGVPSKGEAVLSVVLWGLQSRQLCGYTYPHVLHMHTQCYQCCAARLCTEPPGTELAHSQY